MWSVFHFMFYVLSLVVDNLFAVLSAVFRWYRQATPGSSGLRWFYLKIPARIYLFKYNSSDTRTMCEICSKLTMKTPERRSGVFTDCKIWTDFTLCSGVSIINLTSKYQPEFLHIYCFYISWWRHRSSVSCQDEKCLSTENRVARCFLS